jgi:hypothetical protein
MSDMQNISIKHLHVGNLEVCDAINDNVASIVLLTTRFGVEARAVKEDAKYRVFGESGCRLDE